MQPNEARDGTHLLVILMRLIHVLTKLARGTKDRLVPIIDVNGLVGLWVAPSARRAVLDLEHPKTAQLDALPLFHRLLHRGHESHHDGFGLYLGQSSALCNTVNNIGLGHGRRPGQARRLSHR